ncbi:MAG TPA: glycosyltransferase family 2 protein [Gemmatimonadaceae bacterium]|jgi:glycosyltransferase involved in cell wall biosynthesis|nr:glycosyltransferase family 2 protein [Gemmatimonadaceae bacterium]
MPLRLITVVTPCFNEETNTREIYEAVKAEFLRLPNYRYEHLFIDNGSTDATPSILRALAAEDKNVKVILNTRNFGPVRSPMYGLLQADGDAVIGISADFQDPPALIPKLLDGWEKGAWVVLGVKVESDEGRLMYAVRGAYYRLLASVADVDIIQQATGFGLYDQRVMEALRRIAGPYPFLRGLVAEMGFPMLLVPFHQEVRRSGKSKNNLYALIDTALLGLVSHSKVPLRIATLSGAAAAGVSLLVGVGYLVAKLIWWNNFSLGIAPLVIGFFFLSALQLIFVGVVGEYVGAIYTYVKNRPLVFERERLNF